MMYVIILTVILLLFFIRATYINISKYIVLYLNILLEIPIHIFVFQQPIVLDALKQHYFLDRDGNMFRYILNFLRTTSLALPDDFQELDLLIEESMFFELEDMQHQLLKFKETREMRKRQKVRELYDA